MGRPADEDDPLQVVGREARLAQGLPGGVDGLRDEIRDDDGVSWVF